jgi:hypothetical protein
MCGFRGKFYLEWKWNDWTVVCGTSFQGRGAWGSYCIFVGLRLWTGWVAKLFSWIRSPESATYRLLCTSRITQLKYRSHLARLHKIRKYFSHNDDMLHVTRHTRFAEARDTMLALSSDTSATKVSHESNIREFTWKSPKPLQQYRQHSCSQNSEVWNAFGTLQ